MKKILLMLMLFVMPVSAEMRKVEIPVKVVCWDSLEEALEYHAKTLGEFPIIKLYTDEMGGGALLVKPDGTQWTFLAFRHDPENNRIISCAFFEGKSWKIIKVPLLEPERDIEI